MAQTGEIQSGGCYLPQNDLRLHFGLGMAETLDEAESKMAFRRGRNLKHYSAEKFHIVEEGLRIVSGQDMLAKPPRITGTGIGRVQ